MSWEKNCWLKFDWNCYKTSSIFTKNSEKYRKIPKIPKQSALAELFPSVFLGHRKFFSVPKNFLWPRNTKGKNSATTDYCGILIIFRLKLRDFGNSSGFTEIFVENWTLFVIISVEIPVNNSLLRLFYFERSIISDILARKRIFQLFIEFSLYFSENLDWNFSFPAIQNKNSLLG